MKKLTILFLLFSMLAYNASFAQTDSKKTPRKKIQMTEENGVRVMIVTTTENGKKTTKKYKGAEVDVKLKEMMYARPHLSVTNSSAKIDPKDRKEIKR